MVGAIEGRGVGTRVGRGVGLGVGAGDGAGVGAGVVNSEKAWTCFSSRFEPGHHATSSYNDPSSTSPSTTIFVDGVASFGACSVRTQSHCFVSQGPSLSRTVSVTLLQSASEPDVRQETKQGTCAIQAMAVPISTTSMKEAVGLGDGTGLGTAVVGIDVVGMAEGVCVGRGVGTREGRGVGSKLTLGTGVIVGADVGNEVG